jgi:hypothetical protein
MEVMKLFYRSGKGKSKEVSKRNADSDLEQKLLDGVLSKFELHPKITFKYAVPHTYKPDFYLVTEQGKEVFIESKGQFKDAEDARKHVFKARIVEYTGAIFIMLFQRPNCPMIGSRKRKDGTRYRQAEWATKNNIPYSGQTDIMKVIKEIIGDDDFRQTFGS